MKLKLLALSLPLLGLSALSTLSYAEDTHASGFLVGAGAAYNDFNLPGGTFTVTNNDANTSTSVTASSKKFMFNLHAGYLFDVGSGFDVGPLFAFEYYLPYTLNATDNSGNEKIHVYDFNLQLAGQYTWQSFFARINAGEGFFALKGNKDGGDSTDIVNNRNEWKPLAGFGVGYYFTPDFNVGLFYQHIFGSTISGGELLPSANTVGLNVEYTFGTLTSGA